MYRQLLTTWCKVLWWQMLSHCVPLVVIHLYVVLTRYSSLWARSLPYNWFSDDLPQGAFLGPTSGIAPMNFVMPVLSIPILPAALRCSVKMNVFLADSGKACPKEGVHLVWWRAVATSLSQADRHYNWRELWFDADAIDSQDARNSFQMFSSIGLWAV